MARVKKKNIQIVIDKIKIDIPVSVDIVDRVLTQYKESTIDTDRLGKSITYSMSSILNEAYAPPSPKQISYAKHIAKTLDIELPKEALRLKTEMGKFISKYVDEVPPSPRP